MMVNARVTLFNDTRVAAAVMTMFSEWLLEAEWQLAALKLNERAPAQQVVLEAGNG